MIHIYKDSFEDFHPLDFLFFAEELYCVDTFKSNKSAVERTIFGRIYYALFLFLREWLLEHTQYNSNKFGEHTRIPNFIKSEGPFDSIKNHEVYLYFNALKKLRHQADYYLKVPNENNREYSDWIFADIDFALYLIKVIISYCNNYKK